MADDSRTEGDRFSPAVPSNAEPYPLKGSSGARATSGHDRREEKR